MMPPLRHASHQSFPTGDYFGIIAFKLLKKITLMSIVSHCGARSGVEGKGICEIWWINLTSDSNVFCYYFSDHTKGPFLREYRNVAGCRGEGVGCSTKSLSARVQ
jgi:hypothetical protein